MSSSAANGVSRPARVFSLLGRFVGQVSLAFLAALHFLTIVPPVVRRPFRATEMGQAVGFYPLVGVLLGGTLLGLDGLLRLLWPLSVTTTLLLTTWVLLTGALHLDGFLDSCDGLWGGQSPEVRLRILRDERVGAYAVIGGVLLLLVKYAALEKVPDRGAALLLAPTLGRWGMCLAVIACPYARSEGLGRDVKDHAGWAQGILATATAVAVAWLAVAWLGLLALVVAGVATWAGARFVLRRLPGLTGDIYGALCEMLEVLVLLTLLAGTQG